MMGLNDERPPTAVEGAAAGLSSVAAVATIVEAVMHPGMWFEYAILPVMGGLVYGVFTLRTWWVMGGTPQPRSLGSVPARPALERRARPALEGKREPLKVAAVAGVRRELPAGGRMSQ